jgi:hypothetical protein
VVSTIQEQLHVLLHNVAQIDPAHLWLTLPNTSRKNAFWERWAQSKWQKVHVTNCHH